MRGRIYFLVLLSLNFLILLSCSNNFNSKSIDSEFSLVQDNAQSLLNVSLTINYPEDGQFVPTKVYGTTLIGEFSPVNSAPTVLVKLDTKSNEIEKIKEIEETSEIVTFIVHYIDDKFVIFEEFDQINQEVRYYIWKNESKTYQQFHKIEKVNPIHFTQIARSSDKFYINAFTENDMYHIYSYDVQLGKLEKYIENNSSSPIVIDGFLYYISIDNQKLETAIIKQNLETKSVEVVEKTDSPSEFLTGLYSNGSSIIKAKMKQNIIELYLDDAKEPFFKDDWVESLEFKGSYITFIGNKRSEDRIRPQYYLLDIEEGIDYRYDDSIILLSNDGIFWVEFKKAETEIEKGSIFTTENSVMRFYPFEK